ncbi:Guanosine polyphosphate pyrophosphohydrolases/synthetases [Luteimonas sp. J16]|jgi:guanosine-3',5'-bis(diphosphate) 3'-pyrophosphohydrolase|uniref:HD domain-containing protein n=1 Tax=unclassified Luteimonas TaxID=2629088 RepID=UPI000478934F|nr:MULTISPECIES: HD domain-containing protein [unclassified Luteimonas]TWG94582.1 Guanosine polyphosphate pyrophosphohydrolases/synthetases [Luteimonas sp. J16]
MSHDIQPLARVVDAIAFAAHAHRAQRRKDADATPYINHPVALVRILAVEAGIDDPDVLCAAALHDYLEDCCGRDGQPSPEEGRRQLRDRFGEAVLAYVEAVTDDKTLPKAERKRLQVEHARHAPHGARLVKLADKIANLRDLIEFPPADWPAYRRREYFEWAAEVVTQLKGTHQALENLFEHLVALRPRGAGL